MVDVEQEEERPFSVAAEWKKIAAGVLGAVNLGGALYLQNLLSGPALAGVALPGVYGFVQVCTQYYFWEGQGWHR